MRFKPNSRCSSLEERGYLALAPNVTIVWSFTQGFPYRLVTKILFRQTVTVDIRYRAIDRVYLKLVRILSAVSGRLRRTGRCTSSTTKRCIYGFAWFLWFVKSVKLKSAKMYRMYLKYNTRCNIQRVKQTLA